VCWARTVDYQHKSCPVKQAADFKGQGKMNHG